MDAAFDFVVHRVHVVDDLVHKQVPPVVVPKYRRFFLFSCIVLFCFAVSRSTAAVVEKTFLYEMPLKSTTPINTVSKL